jgi:hypothetical protein
MIPKAIARRLSTWVIGLFVIAQIFAVVPLMSEHTTHEAQTSLSFSQDRVSAGHIPQGHHHGDADGFIQHHELQDLSGALTCAVSQCEIAAVRVAVAQFEPDALAEGDPILLEHPPKTLLSA